MSSLTLAPNGTGYVCIIASVNEDGDHASITYLIGRRGRRLHYGIQRPGDCHAAELVYTDTSSMVELLCGLLFEVRRTVLSGTTELDKAQDAVRNNHRARSWTW